MPSRTLSLAIAIFVGFSAAALMACGPSDPNRLPLGHFDAPRDNSIIRGMPLVGGWAADRSGIEGVGIYVDGHYLRGALRGVDRADVLKIHPELKPSMITGWNIPLDTSALPAGPHVLSAKIIANSGAQRDFSIHVTVAK